MEAGLPNITGDIGNGQLYLVTNEQYVTGVFANSSYTRGGTGFASANISSRWNKVNFSANKSDTTYGSSATVTPLSMSCKFYISY